MELQIIQKQISMGCKNPQCFNQYCKTSSFYRSELQQGALNGKVIVEIYNRLGNMAICVPSVAQILSRWTVHGNLLETWSVDLVERPILQNQLSILELTDWQLLSSVLSVNLSSLEQLEYFLLSGISLDQSIQYNHQFFTTLLELEQLDPSLQVMDQIIEMTGPVTRFVQKLTDVLFGNTFVLAKGPDCIPSPNLLIAMLTLPEQFIERSNISTACIATLFETLPKNSLRIDFYESLLKFLKESPQRYEILDQIISSCNQYISVTLSLQDRPRKPASVLDLIPQRDEFISVVELLQLVNQILNGLPPSPMIQPLVQQLQNEYVNSNAYDLRPDADFWLQSNHFQLDISSLPVPLQVLVQQRDRPRQFPPGMFTLLNYPFLINSGTKAQLFRYEATHGVPHLNKLQVSRDNIVNDTMDFVTKLSPEFFSSEARAMLRIPMKIEFQGEEGIDAGGLSNEFFSLICEQLFSSKYNLFKYYPDQRVFWLHKFPMLEPAELETYYAFVGVVLGLAMLNGVNVNYQFPSFFYKKLCDDIITLEDLKQLDEQLYDSLMFVKNYDQDDIETALCQTFSVTEAVFGQDLEVDLVPNGREIPVTSFNKDEYVRTRLEYETETAVREQFAALKAGFKAVTECSTFGLFSHSELERVMCGEQLLDFDALRKNTKYQLPYTETHKISVWFWKILTEDFDEDQRKKFMRFTFGSERAPAGGLSRQRFEIHKNGEDDNRLPTSHTCFGILMLPEYGSYQVLRDKLAQAIEHYEGFGLQ